MQRKHVSIYPIESNKVWSNRNLSLKVTAIKIIFCLTIIHLFFKSGLDSLVLYADDYKDFVTNNFETPRLYIYFKRMCT